MAHHRFGSEPGNEKSGVARVVGRFLAFADSLANKPGNSDERVSNSYVGTSRNAYSTTLLSVGCACMVSVMSETVPDPRRIATTTS